MYSKENLSRIAKLNELAPEAMKAFWAFDKLAVADGAIPAKYKELIAVAVAVTTQCPYCIDAYTRACLEKGSNLGEMTEAVHVVNAIRGGASLVHGVQMRKIAEKLSL